MALPQFFMFLMFLHSVRSTSFSYPSFEASPQNIKFTGDASSESGFIQLTGKRPDVLTFNIGRAEFARPIRLWDSSTGQAADFITRFSFNISWFSPTVGADGLAFFLVPNGSTIPPASIGENLGLFSASSRFNSSDNPVVAVEFDTFWNEWDPRSDHVGIDVNSIKSEVTWNTTNFTLKNGSIGHVLISYNASANNFTVYFSYAANPVFNGTWILSHVLNLSSILPEWISVGFSGATGTYAEVHKILSWEFNSTDFPSTETNSTNPGNGGGSDKDNVGVVIGSVVGGIVLAFVIGLFLFIWWKKHKEKENEDDSFLDISSDDDYEKGTGPKRFAYEELVLATNKFAEEGKLGEGGFGGVYRGLLSYSNTDIAVKRVSRGSKQGKKEFVSEVKIISQLRHRNLVQLIGWCHEKGEFLLVYEFMPNGSLDFHLFGGRTMITWALRYKIALGLASSLLYLHEEWEQCVVHRDIKSSNVMLDSSFNAKLGDFGLARLADHELGMKTTMLAGTMGYLAPECVVTGKAGKESDVYSFGVVALEIACGRRVVEPREEEGKVGLVAWVWGLYGSGRLLEAADAKLGTDFDEQQMERLMIVGLWCANLDHKQRPSIRQAISVLNFEATLPELPFKMSAPNYNTSSTHNVGFSYASSSSYTNSQGNQSQVSSNSYSTNSSQMSTSASASLLQLATI